MAEEKLPKPPLPDRSFNAREQAWLVALQSIPAKFIPPHLNIGVRWINTPTYTDYACRIHKDLVPFPTDPRVAQAVLPKTLTTAATAIDARSTNPPAAPAGATGA